MESQAAQLQEAKIAVPTPCGLSHIAIPSRDLDQSKQFFVDVLGGELTVDEPALARIQFGNFGIVLAPQVGGATPAHAEYPHYAFTAAPERFYGDQAAIGRLRRTNA